MDRVPILAQQVMQAAQTISLRLGYIGTAQQSPSNSATRCTRVIARRDIGRPPPLEQSSTPSIPSSGDFLYQVFSGLDAFGFDLKQTP